MALLIAINLATIIGWRSETEPKSEQIIAFIRESLHLNKLHPGSCMEIIRPSCSIVAINPQIYFLFATSADEL